MTLLLTGINNENEFYTNYYLSEVFDKTDLKDITECWRSEAEKNGNKVPPDQLRSLSNDYFRFKNALDKESEADRRLALQREFSASLLAVFGYKQDSTNRVLDDNRIVPILCELSRGLGQSGLWILEGCTVTESADGDVDPLALTFNINQFGRTDDPTRCITYESLEDLISKEIFSQTEPPRWVIIVSDSQVILIDRSKWNDQRLLRFDLEEILARRETSTLAATCAFLHRDHLISTQGQSLLDSLDEKSHKHSQTVTQDLKYALQQCIEIIGNEAIHYMRTTAKEKVFEREIEKQLTLECLRFMYRLLFILYIESREELGYAPMKSDAYRLGCSFDSLRDLEVLELTTEEARTTYYIHDSIKLLFDLIYSGYPEYEKPEESLKKLFVKLHAPGNDSTPDAIRNFGFDLFPLRSHLFDPAMTPLLNKMRLRNSEMLQVIKLMSLSKAKGNKQRSGRISYAQLGINQLGAVYEALLCFNGFFAEEDLYEVQPAPKKSGRKTSEDDEDSDFDDPDDDNDEPPKKGKGKDDVRNTRDALEIAYVVPKNELEKYAMDERVFDDQGRQKFYEKGRFIYRLAGRDRQKSASYYTPDVLTHCLVKYSLTELLKDKSADDILHLKICEPAMGSAAFLNECVNQLADAYLERKQDELSKRISHDEYALEKQKVKMFIADRNVFGVDLNPVAVELAEVSLWLNSIFEGAFVPWFGMQLVCGNSLVGARKQTYSRDLLMSRRKGQALWYDNEPERMMPGTRRNADHVYHFLLSDPGMSKYDDKAVKDLANNHITTIDTWRKTFTKPLSDAELKSALQLSAHIDDLWKQHCNNLRTLRARTTDPLTIFGRAEDKSENLSLTEQKDELFKQEGLAAEVASSSAYSRLKLVMDYWCALWFWPILESERLPTRAEFLATVSTIVSPPTNADAGTLETQIDENEQLKIVRALASRYRFMHWELEFADIFEDNGGFDLVIGNPPWIKMEWQESGILSDYDPSFVVKNISASDTAKARKATIEKYQMLSEYLGAYEEREASQGFVNSTQNYPLLKGVQSNSFKCFLPQGWMVANRQGIVSYIHPEGVYDDPKGGALRRQMYRKLRYHFQHQNKLILFPISDQKKYSLNVYGNHETDDFISISNIFHPRTIDMSIGHDGAGTTPGIKGENNKWDLSGHRDRLIIADQQTLGLFAHLCDSPGTPALEARLPVLHARSLVTVLQRFASQPAKLADLAGSLIPSEFWHETNQQNDGTIRRKTAFVDSAEQFVYSGPHFHIGNPFWKTPRRVCTENGHYDVVDLANIPAGYLPRTNYVPACDMHEYRRRTPDAWDGTKVIDHYRLIARRRLSTSMERTLISAIAPPKRAHLDGVFGLTFRDESNLILTAGLFASIVMDFFIKSTGKSDFRADLARYIPLLASDNYLDKFIALRVLRLNCLSTEYGPLWEHNFSELFKEDGWTGSSINGDSFQSLSHKWNITESPVRMDLQRRQALLELDVLCSLTMQISLNELLSMYKIQFPVMRQYERETFYDQTGRIVFTVNKGLPGVGVSRKIWDEITGLQRGTYSKAIEDDTMSGGPVNRTITYQAPFFSMNREHDYEVAWKEFSGRLGISDSVAIQVSTKLSSVN